MSDPESPFGLSELPTLSSLGSPVNATSPIDTTVGLPNPYDKKTQKKKLKSKDDDESWRVKRQKIPKVVGVRLVDFEHFKNRYCLNEGLEIIEVLQGHQNIADEISREILTRNSHKRPYRGSMRSIVDGEQGWIQQVRIQSPQILLLLSRLTGHRDEWDIDSPRVFFRPFRAFHYYLPRMKDCLNVLEEKWAQVDARDGEERGAATDFETTSKAQAKKPSDWDDSDSVTSDIHGVGHDTGPIDPERAVSGQIVDSVVALRHVREYVKFVEERIKPLWEFASGTMQRKVSFLDLWMTFQHGELLYVPLRSAHFRLPPGSQIVINHGTWRLYSMEFVKDDDKKHPSSTYRYYERPKRKIALYTYYIDFNGTSYWSVPHTFAIEEYEGERDITSFEVYPLRFVKDWERMKNSGCREGQWFQDAVREKHLYYDGWTLSQGPIGFVRPEYPNMRPSSQINSEYIDGDVIVDFSEGYKADNAIGRPSFNTMLNFPDADWPSGYEALTIKYWENGRRSKSLGEIKEFSQREELFRAYLRKCHAKENKFIAACEAGRGVLRLEGDEASLLPRRLIAYAFRERKFVIVDVRSLKRVPAPQSIFGDLKIDEDHKRMVKSLVKSHFQKKNIQKRIKSIGLNQDLIQGKGSGLVILLHGVPGVGKTATAEAVAQANKKPLFVITCGDLGFTPKDVETSLRDIFRLAHLWDCVLLLDEADIFLSRREMTDLKRNALVSVFLRVLEYYNGILFLTTNRVGHLDEAFKSRIHISLYYPPLSEDQALAIFEVNIRKLQEIEEEKQRLQAETDPADAKQPAITIDRDSILDYAAWHFKSHVPDQRWNGRQIRNAFQISYSLAQFDMHKTSLDRWDDEDADASESGPQAASKPQLDYRMFQLVAKAIERFDGYLHDAISGNDMDNARNLGIRADDHNPSDWEGPTYYPHHQPTRREHHQGYTSAHHLGSRPEARRHAAGYNRPQPPPPRYHHQAPPPEYQPPRPAQQRQRPPPTRAAAPHQESEGSRLSSQRAPRLQPRKPWSRPQDNWRGDLGYSGWTAGPPMPEPEDYSRPFAEEGTYGDDGQYADEQVQPYGDYDDEERGDLIS